MNENTYDSNLLQFWIFGDNGGVEISRNAMSNNWWEWMVQDYIVAGTLLQQGVLGDQGNCDGTIDEPADNAFGNGFTTDILSQINPGFTYYHRPDESGYDLSPVGVGTVNVQLCNNPIQFSSYQCDPPLVKNDADILAMADEKLMNREVVKKFDYYIELGDTASALALLENAATDMSKGMLLPYYLKDENYAELDQKLGELPEDELDEIYFKELYHIYKAARQEGRKHFELTPDEEATVRTIAASHTKSAFDARTLLYLAYGEEYPIPLPDYPPMFDPGALPQWQMNFKTAEKDGEARFGVFPNPANGKLYVKAQGQPENASFALYDLAGNLLKRRDLNAATVELNTSDLPPGMYLYQIQTPGDTLRKGKVAIIR